MLVLADERIGARGHVAGPGTGAFAGLAIDWTKRSPVCAIEVPLQACFFISRFFFGTSKKKHFGKVAANTPSKMPKHKGPKGKPAKVKQAVKDADVSARRVRASCRPAALVCFFLTLLEPPAIASEIVRPAAPLRAGLTAAVVAALACGVGPLK